MGWRACSLARGDAMAGPVDPRSGHVLTEREARSRRARNIAIGLGVGALVLIFYAVTIVKLGPGVLRPS